MTAPTAPITVVGLADEFGLTTAEMLVLCERVGVDAHDGSSLVSADTVLRLRELHRLSRPRPPLVAPPKSEPEMVSPLGEAITTRRVLAISLIVVSAASVLGVVVDQLMR